ncbi:MAG: hypothetical protein K8S87_00215, partial [Planctomycetes bacterium]|nr:hypothetical protein [Planctomycetota bacterium]
QYTYTDATGKVEIDGRKYDDSNRMEWNHYTDSVHHAKVEDQIKYTDGVLMSVAKRKLDLYHNVIEQKNVNGLKTVLSYKDKTCSLEKALTYDGSTIKSYSENVYDTYLNVTESYGPCIVNSASPTKTSSPVKETKVVYDYVDATYGAKHLIRKVQKYTNTSDYFQTEYFYQVVEGQQDIDDYYRLDYSIDNNASGVSNADQRKTDYSYYSATNLAVGVIKGFVSQVQVDDIDGTTSSLFVITKYRNYISGALKETKNSLGITTQYIYDTDGFGRTLGTCSDADHTVGLSTITTNDSGNKIQVHTSEDHGLSATDAIRLIGTTSYDGAYTVDSVIDSDDFVVNTAFISSEASTTALVEKVGTGLEQGSKSTYQDYGLINNSQSGEFSNWDQAASPQTYSIDTTEAYSQSDYKFDTTYGRLIATRGRSISSVYYGSTYAYFGNGAIDETKSGKINWTATPSIETSNVNYSHSKRTYYVNGWTKKTESLVTGTTFATTEYWYNKDGSTDYVKGPKFGDNVTDVHEAYYYYDVLGRNIKTKSKVGVGQWSNSETIYDNEYFRVYQSKQEKTEGSYYTTTYTYAEEAVPSVFYPNRVIKTTAPGGYETKYTHDAYGRVTTTEMAAQSTSNEEMYSHRSYDILGRVIWSGVTDYNHSTPGTDFVNCKNKTKRFYNYNSAVYKSYSYDDTTTYTQVDTIYNALGQTIASCTDPTALKLGSVNTYNSLGQTTEVKRSKFSTFSSASASFVSTSDTTGYTWDGSAEELVTEYTYDEDGKRETIVKNPDGATYGDLTTTYVYDELGNIKQVTDANNESTTYEHNNAGWQTKVTDALSVPTEYAYYNNGQRKSYTYYQQSSYIPANAITITTEYYPSNAISKVLYPGYDSTTPTTGNDVRENTYQYNLSGQMTQAVYGNNPDDGSDNGNKIGYVYDSSGRFQYYDEGDNGTYERQYVYNDRNQVKEIKRSGTGEYFTTYDGYGRITNVQDKAAITAGKTVDYAYYDNGALKSVVDPEDERTFYYHYDKASRIFQVNSSATLDAGTIYNEYAYNALSQKTYQYYGSDTSNNGFTEYSYLDDVGWVTEIENKVGSDTYSNFKYYDSGWAASEKYDKLGNIKRMYYNIRTDNEGTPNFSEGNIHYTYDDIYQLTDEERKQSDNTTRIYLYEYAYDAFGNRTDKDFDSDGDGNIDEAYNYTYNPANQLVYEDGPTTDWHYVYDGNGNLTYRKDNLLEPTHTDAYTYNYQNQLTEYDPQGASNTTTYTYNLAGERVRKDSAELETDYKFVYANGQIITEYDADDSDALLRTNIWVPGATTLINNAETDAFYYTFRDGFNSVYNVIDASGNLQNKYDYTAFGEPYQWTEPTIPNTYTFNSNQYNSESTAYFNGSTYRNSTNNICFQTQTQTKPATPQTKPINPQTQPNPRTRPATGNYKRCIPAFINVTGKGTSAFADDHYSLGPNTEYFRIGYAFDAYLVAKLEGNATIQDCEITQYIFMFWTYKRRNSNHVTYWHHERCQSGSDSDDG